MRASTPTSTRNGHGDHPIPREAAGDGSPLAEALARAEPAEPWSLALEAGDRNTLIRALARLSPLEYDRVREKVAEHLGCRTSTLDREVTDARRKDTGGGDGCRPAQADLLVEIAAEAEPFRSPDAVACTDIEVAGHRETWPVRSQGFRRWLCRRFYEETGKVPGTEALQAALGVIEARALFDAPERQLFVRVAEHEGRIFLDLADAAWRAVEITARGWRVVERPPVRFRRAAGMRPLPVPEPGGRVETLRRFLNVGDDDFVLVVAWLLAALRGRGPYSVLALSGEQGSGKSTAAAMLRALVDPNAAPLRALPREDRDLFIAAKNAHLLAFDNVSGIPGWLSDTLCRLATGGGFAVRQLYSDQDEVLFDATRPIVLNGIEDVIGRPDLADRAIFVTLEAIPEEHRRPEAELWAAFEAARPAILGALLDAVAEGLRRLPDVRLPGLPRMADFALWASACETAFTAAGAFWEAYAENREGAIWQVIEADPVASAVRALVADRRRWRGTVSELLTALGELAGERLTRSKSWPTTPRALSGRLRRAATFLRRLGVEIAFLREGRDRRRIVEITAIPPEDAGTFASAPSAPSASSEIDLKINDLGADANEIATVPTPSASPNQTSACEERADATAALWTQDGRNGPPRPSALKSLKHGTHSGLDRDADGADAKIPPFSGERADGVGERWDDVEFF